MLQAMPDARPKAGSGSNREVRTSVAPSLAEKAAPSDDDISLVRRVAVRDVAAFEALVRRYQDRVFGFCLRLLNDRAEAEDVAQEVFLAFYRSAGDFRGDSSLSTWLLRIAKNQALNRVKYLERRGRSKQRSIEDCDEQRLSATELAQVPRTPDAIVESEQLSSLVKDAIAQLDPEQRAVVVLRDVDDLSYEEIADITGLPVGTVKSRIHRGRSTLAAILKRIFR